MKKYTIIGFWDDNQQPYVVFVKGKSPEDAIKNHYEELKASAQLSLSYALQNDESPASPDQIWIVGVIAGHHKEIGGLDCATRLADMFEED